MSELRISESFYSLQGESSSVGVPTYFIRLTGCPLRCTYCDTEYAFHGGQLRSFQDLFSELADYQGALVCVTGGEPLAQPGVIPFMQHLCDMDFKVSLETSGALSLEKVDERVRKVMDLKTPASGEVGRNHYENIKYLTPKDEVKFVIKDRLDYDWSKQKCLDLGLFDADSSILFSPSHEFLEPRYLADWILADKLPVRFQLQLHKYIWGDIPGV